MAKMTTSRRNFLKQLGVGAGATALAAAGFPLLAGRAAASTQGTAGAGPALAAPQVELLVADVIGFQLATDDWAGDFGWVKFRLNGAFYNGESAYYIRTDASDQEFAEQEGLVWVPLLNAALARDEAHSNVYVFTNGTEDQLPVLSTVPEQEDYNPAWRVNQVTFNGDASLVTSVEELDAADVTIEALNLVVNYPVVKWPGGELAADEALEEALGGGPLVQPVDTDAMEVNFKLHQCYPGSRYIITDTSAVPMAPMMSIVGSGNTQVLQELGAVDSIWVFGNGLAGPGVMGAQPAVFRNEPGTPTWSPFWDHYVILWNDPDAARVLHNAVEVQAALDAGEIEIFNGTPDTHPNGFVVNCPVPIKARNTYEDDMDM